MSLLSNLNRIDDNWCKAKYRYKGAENAYFNPSVLFTYNRKLLQHEFDIKYRAMMWWERYYNKKKVELDIKFKELL